LAAILAGDKRKIQDLYWEIQRPKYKHLGWRDDILRDLNIDEQLASTGYAQKREGWTGPARYAYLYRF
jgi:hypothetical protein